MAMVAIVPWRSCASSCKARSSWSVGIAFMKSPRSWYSVANRKRAAARRSRSPAVRARSVWASKKPISSSDDTFITPASLDRALEDQERAHRPVGHAIAVRGDQGDRGAQLPPIGAHLIEPAQVAHEAFLRLLEHDH